MSESGTKSRDKIVMILTYRSKMTVDEF